MRIISGRFVVLAFSSLSIAALVFFASHAAAAPVSAVEGNQSCKAGNYTCVPGTPGCLKGNFCIDIEQGIGADVVGVCEKENRCRGTKQKCSDGLWYDVGKCPVPKLNAATESPPPAEQIPSVSTAPSSPFTNYADQNPLPPTTQSPPSGQAAVTPGVSTDQMLKSLVQENGVDAESVQGKNMLGAMQLQLNSSLVDAKSLEPDVITGSIPPSSNTLSPSGGDPTFPEQTEKPAPEVKPASPIQKAEEFTADAWGYMKGLAKSARKAFSWGTVPSDDEAPVDGSANGITGGAATVETASEGRLCITDGRPCQSDELGITQKDFFEDPKGGTPVRGIASLYKDDHVSSLIPGGALTNPNLFASLYLPLGTVVTVCGQNNSCTQGVIGDVGPALALEGRVVDLPYQAGAEIGNGGLGQATVFVNGVCTGGVNSTENVGTCLVALNESKRTGESFSNVLKDYQSLGGSPVQLAGPSSPIIPVSGPKGGGWSVPDTFSYPVAFNPNRLTTLPGIGALTGGPAPNYQIAGSS